MTTTTAARTVLATLALIAGSLFVVAPPATATPDQHSGHCSDFGERYKTWTLITTENLNCDHAHNVARRWSGCGRSTSHVTPLHCQVEETVAGHASTFYCANTKASSSPASYKVHCHNADGRKVSFVFYAYGL